jgi:hypothetical protein
MRGAEKGRCSLRNEKENVVDTLLDDNEILRWKKRFLIICGYT